MWAWIYLESVDPPPPRWFLPSSISCLFSALPIWLCGLRCWGWTWYVGPRADTSGKATHSWPTVIHPRPFRTTPSWRGTQTWRFCSPSVRSVFSALWFCHIQLDSCTSLDRVRLKIWSDPWTSWILISHTLPLSFTIRNHIGNYGRFCADSHIGTAKSYQSCYRDNWRIGNVCYLTFTPML